VRFFDQASCSSRPFKIPFIDSGIRDSEGSVGRFHRVCPGPFPVQQSEFLNYTAALSLQSGLAVETAPDNRTKACPERAITPASGGQAVPLRPGLRRRGGDPHYFATNNFVYYFWC